MLALLVEAQQTLHDDPQIAWEYIEQVGSLIRLACTRIASGPPMIRAWPAHQPPPIGGLAAWQARKVVQYIDMNLAANIKAEDLAGQANLSTGHFFRAFKITIGETPHNYIMRQRVRRAQLMMLETNDTLSQIASACGLADQAHLTRLFKRMVGATPLVWRRCWQSEGAQDQAFGALT
ncbi:helix-turn-helix transcriptional regulator [Novosphingobium profundi]|nr:helix-turn-helix transcriptional regulator [Novosphingobium profundi]